MSAYDPRILPAMYFFTGMWSFADSFMTSFICNPDLVQKRTKLYNTYTGEKMFSFLENV